MGERFDVCEYSIDRLRDLIVEKSRSSGEVVAGKLHSIYFDEYFSALGARTVVVENDYIDRDYLEDYAGYYVRCFERYQRVCTRLHFFQAAFDRQAFEALLTGSATGIDQRTLNDSYLGFVVVKPLPQTVIGRTCLVTYPPEGRRYYTALRKYIVNLFGVELGVTSLAFQEQDQVVAACATSALWSVLQGTGELFHHPMLSPVEITKAATEHLPTDTRTFPNRGLSMAMMAHGIRNAGLEPYLVNVGDEYVFTSTLYAYLRFGIPMILGVELIDPTGSAVRSLGLHAVAITGYSLGRAKPKPYGSSGFLLRASRIDKVYVHDDQVGPFARMVLDGRTVPIKQGRIARDVNSISTSWVGADGKIGSVRARLENLMIPVYHKIRIPFATVHDTIIAFDGFLEALKKHGAPIYSGRLEWDIHLSTVNQVKSEILRGAFSGGYFKEFLLAKMPRFLWRASALSSGNPVLDLFFDATDIEQGRFFVRAIEYDARLAAVLRAVTKVKQVKDAYGTQSVWKIMEWFSKQ